MKSSIKKLFAFLVDAKSMLFGVAIFNFVWVWMSLPEYQFRNYIFLAGLLLAASILIRLNTLWSNLIAAILSGCLPIEILWEFWLFPDRAEVPMFSWRHFRLFFLTIDIKTVLVISTALTLLMLTRSVYAILSNGRSASPEDRAS